MSTKIQKNSDDITVDVQKEAGCQVSMEVAITPSGCERFFKKALKSVNKEVSLPGFRKGRAPDAMILKNFGSHVDSEWRTLLVRESFELACKDADLYPFQQESIKKPELKECSREDGAKILFKFETYPDIPEIKAEELSIDKVEPKEISEKDVESTLHDIRTVHADWDPVEGRSVEEGDFVDLTIESLDEPGKMLCEDKRFEVAAERMGKWMMDLVLGMEIGATIEGESALEEGKEEEIKNFKPTRVKIALNAIKSIKLPEFNDALAQKLGKETVDELRAAVEKDLAAGAERDARSTMTDKLDEVLMEKYVFDIPLSLLEAERQPRLRYRLAQLKKDGLSDDEIKEKEQDVEAEVVQAAERALRLMFLVHAIAEQFKLSVTEDELMSELSHQLWGVPEHERVLTQDMEPQEIRSRLHSKIMGNKARETLLERILAV